MQIGIFSHPLFGLTFTFISKNKRMQRTTSPIPLQWQSKYLNLADNHPDLMHPKFYLLPQQIVDYEVYNQTEGIDLTPIIKSNTKTVTIYSTELVYEYYGMTLQHELQYRSKKKLSFTILQLWYILYCLTCGGNELLKLHQQANIKTIAFLGINDVLIDPHGKIKVVGAMSHPLLLGSQDVILSIYNYFEGNQTNIVSLSVQQQQLSLALSIGLIMIELAMMKPISAFIDTRKSIKSAFNHIQFGKWWYPYRDKLGPLWKIISLMICEDHNKRIKSKQVRALLQPYTGQILSLKQFVLDRQHCKKSLQELIVLKPN